MNTDLTHDLSEARRILLEASRALSRAHEQRFRSGKSDQAAITRCRDADRHLQHAAVAFAFQLAIETGLEPTTMRVIEKDLLEAIR